MNSRTNAMRNAFDLLHSMPAPAATIRGRQHSLDLSDDDEIERTILGSHIAKKNTATRRAARERLAKADWSNFDPDAFGTETFRTRPARG